MYFLPGRPQIYTGKLRRQKRVQGEALVGEEAGEVRRVFVDLGNSLYGTAFVFGQLLELGNVISNLMLAIEEVAGGGHILRGGGGSGEADEMLAGGENQSVGVGRVFAEFFECCVAILEQNLPKCKPAQYKLLMEEGRTLTVFSGTMPCASM